MMKCYIIFVICLCSALAQDSFDDTGVKFALKLFNECSSKGLSPCLKMKAYTFLDRLSRMEKFNLTEGVTVTATNTVSPAGTAPVVTEESLEKTLPRSIDSQDEILNNMLMEKVSSLVGSRTVSVALPKISAQDFEDDIDEEGRKIGGGKKGKKGKKGMMGGIMMLLAAKMAVLFPLALGFLFLLTKKALIVGKIALVLSALIWLKKLLASKQGGGGGGHGSGWSGSSSSISSGGWDSGASSGGGHGGWQSNGGGGWDKRSLDEAQRLAYSAYATQ